MKEVYYRELPEADVMAIQLFNQASGDAFETATDAFEALRVATERVTAARDGLKTLGYEVRALGFSAFEIANKNDRLLVEDPATTEILRHNRVAFTDTAAPDDEKPPQPIEWSVLLGDNGRYYVDLSHGGTITFGPKSPTAVAALISREYQKADPKPLWIVFDGEPSELSSLCRKYCLPVKMRQGSLDDDLDDEAGKPVSGSDAVSLDGPGPVWEFEQGSTTAILRRPGHNLSMDSMGGMETIDCLTREFWGAHLRPRLITFTGTPTIFSECKKAGLPVAWAHDPSLRGFKPGDYGQFGPDKPADDGPRVPRRPGDDDLHEIQGENDRPVSGRK